ncbi:MAG: hypothetical protein CME99_11610 [Hyphomonas sp.]|uniref:hypothetical protein n=1 Tax=Hyphomonas TaxID=85 RepID=UPI000B7500E7|nr:MULTISPECIES: hypothetical protein [Hyphomonas]OUX84067.1 MAG: hypothetical protein CBB91_11335 [Hyphomonas sp. TMED31]MAH92661.1 hypothetical protein [Hyphomonas sp.]MAH93806.1 hypothetical protein [Hyphomonas sp.]OUX87636.1 MAG: hypothetical protein CBB91_05510 [Hyphomonas sp. TMED31]HBH43220.1 hypothetical protein [Hyphomonas atlantica]
MNQPTSLIQSALLLRIIAILIFPLGVVVAALLERSVLMVAALAAGMLLASWVERFRLHRLTGHEGYPAVTGLLPGFAVRAGLLAGLFIVCLGVFALFRETSLARGYGAVDVGLFCATTGIALLANTFSARIATQEVSAVMSQMNTGFSNSASSGAGEGNGEIIEGEIIDKE